MSIDVIVVKLQKLWWGRMCFIHLYCIYRPELKSAAGLYMELFFCRIQICALPVYKTNIYRKSLPLYHSTTLTCCMSANEIMNTSVRW